MTKKIWVMIGVLLLVLIFIVVLLLKASAPSKQGTNNKPALHQNGAASQTDAPSGQDYQPPVVNEVSEETKRLNTAEPIVKWTEGLRNKDGVYRYGSDCASKNNCTPSVDDNRVGLAAIWGRFKYYEKRSDPADKEILANDLNTYNDPLKVNVIQNDFWNCRMMYDLITSSLLSPVEKLKAQGICDRGVYSVFDEYQMDQLISKGDVPEPDINAFMQGQKLSTQYILEEDRYRQYAAFASDYVYKYRLNPSKENHDKAILYLGRAAQSYNQGDSSFTASIGHSLFAIAALDVYTMTNDAKYLELSKYLSSKHVEKSACNVLESCTMYAMLGHELFRVTNDESYRRYQDYFIDYLATNYRDKTSNPENFDTSAFHTAGNESRSYPLRYNSVLVALLSMNK